MGDLAVTSLVGPRLIPHLDEVARLRVELLREFPCLCDCDLAHERNYLSARARSPEAIFVIAREGGRIVGFSMGVPMADESDEFKRPFALAGYDPDTLFHFGESILRENCRGRGAGMRFFEEREAHARKLGRFDTLVLREVVRSLDHPKRPPGHPSPDGFWEKRGFVSHPELRTRHLWKEAGEEAGTPKPVTFWLKELG